MLDILPNMVKTTGTIYIQMTNEDQTDAQYPMFSGEETR